MNDLPFEIADMFSALIFGVPLQTISTSQFNF